MVNISIGECLGKGWEGFQRHPGTAIGGFFLYMLISTVGQSIPFLNIVFLIFIAAPLAGGLVILFLRLAKDASPAVGDIFDGFDKYGKFMGAFWLLYAIVLACAIPALIGVGIAMAAERQLGDGAAAIGVTGALVSVVVVIVVAIRWVFVFFLLSDEENLGVIDAFKKSSELTRGWRGKLFGMLFVMSLVSFLGLLLLIVGMFVTGPIVGIGVAWLYTEAKRQVLGTQPGLAAPAVTAPPPIG
jgi:uncharacterized membrane protein